MLHAVAILALVVTTTTSKPPTPTPAKTGQAKQEQTAATKSQTKTDNEAAKNPPSAIQQSNPEITVRYEQQLSDKDKNASAFRDWPALAVAAFTLGLLIVAILQWLAMHGQRRLMHTQARLMVRQLGEMKTTSVDMGILAIAAKDAAAAAKQQTIWAEQTKDAVLRQEKVMLTQTDAMIGQLRAALLAVNAADRSVATTRRYLEAYDRAWVAASLEPHTHLKGEESGPWVTPWLMLTNVGRSVAMDVRYKCRMLPELGGSYRESASHVVQSSPQALFPGEVSRNLIYLVAPDDLMPFAGIVVEGDDRYVRLLIEGEITYRYATSESPHTTKFAYHVGRYEKSKARIVVKIGETIPPDEITFLREPHASYAD